MEWIWTLVGIALANVLVGLAVWFGWVHARWESRRMRVDSRAAGRVDARQWRRQRRALDRVSRKADRKEAL